MPDRSDLAAAAHRLETARRTATRTDLVTDTWPDLGYADALAIATQGLALRATPIVGFKLGFTSAAMRAQMGIERANYGRLTADMAVPALDAGLLFHPRLEPEIALVTARDLTGDSPLDDMALLSAVESVHAALEIVDTRYRAYKFKFADNTADNSSAAGFVLGAPHTPSLLDAPLAVTLTSGKGDCLQGDSTAAMGGPLLALRWLVQTAAQDGTVVPAGSIILTGGLTAAPAIAESGGLEARFEKLGTLRWPPGA